MAQSLTFIPSVCCAKVQILATALYIFTFHGFVPYQAPWCFRRIVAPRQVEANSCASPFFIYPRCARTHLMTGDNSVQWSAQSGYLCLYAICPSVNRDEFQNEPDWGIFHPSSPPIIPFPPQPLTCISC